VLAVEAGPSAEVGRLCAGIGPAEALEGFPLVVVVVDDSAFVARHLNNWLWVTFTRSNPAADIHGVGAFTEQKHWGCTGPVVIDARTKPHHAPPLEEDPQVARRVEALAVPGGPLYGVI
jgi:4-hydroxy-3-polyprenylbenzoate decarboxylase